IKRCCGGALLTISMYHKSTRIKPVVKEHLFYGLRISMEVYYHLLFICEIVVHIMRQYTTLCVPHSKCRERHDIYKPETHVWNLCARHRNSGECLFGKVVS